MSLRETLKVIQDLADKYLIDKPYIVGGLPRDIYMDIPNVKTADIDITTNSAEVLRLGILLADELNVTFELSDDGHLTVFSEEFDVDFSSNFVSEDVVSFFDGKKENLHEAYSRDFTINALHQDLITGEIVDPTGQGFEDIKNKVIKIPVPADITLTDDPRRAYRAINWAARYGFDVAEDIKKFVLENPELFGSENIKDKYISAKISKALKTDEELTLKLLKEMRLFKNIPLAGTFKDVLIERKILVDYLEGEALDHKYAEETDPNYGWGWDRYSNQGPAYRELANWWRSNATNMPDNRTTDYSDWVDWYMTKYRGEWGNIHKGPEETLSIMKEESSGSWVPSSLKSVTAPIAREFGKRKKRLLNIFRKDIPSEERTIERAKKYKPFKGSTNVRVKPGVNVENVTPAVKNFITELGEVAAELGAKVPIITSGWRSVESQSALMGRNWKANGGLNGGREYLEKLYGLRYVGDMASIFEQYGHRSKEAISMGTHVIRRQRVGSHHIADPGKAVDISATDGIKEVLDTIKARGRFDIKILDETNTAGPHYHVAIKGENTRVANIQNRKDKLRKIINY
jgi:hypothetical protein